MFTQTAQFTGVTPERLFRAYVSAEEHAKMTADGRQLVSIRRPGAGAVDIGQSGDELFAFGLRGPDGQVNYRLQATLLRVVPDAMIVMTWKSAAWAAAIDPSEVTDADSVAVLQFAANVAGAEVRLAHINVPHYKARLPDTGETGPLSQIVNTHWSLLYWEPMRRYFSTNPA